MHQRAPPSGNTVHAADAQPLPPWESADVSGSRPPKRESGRDKRDELNERRRSSRAPLVVGRSRSDCSSESSSWSSARSRGHRASEPCPDARNGACRARGGPLAATTITQPVSPIRLHPTLLRRPRDTRLLSVPVRAPCPRGSGDSASGVTRLVRATRRTPHPRSPSTAAVQGCGDAEHGHHRDAPSTAMPTDRCDLRPTAAPRVPHR